MFVNMSSKDKTKKKTVKNSANTLDDRRQIIVKFVPFHEEVDVRVPYEKEPMAIGRICLKKDDSLMMMKARIADLLSSSLPRFKGKIKLKICSKMEDFPKAMKSLPETIYVRLEEMKGPSDQGPPTAPSRGAKRGNPDMPSIPGACSSQKRDKCEWKEPQDEQDPIAILKRSIDFHLKDFVDPTELRNTANEIAMNVYFDHIDEMPRQHPGHIMITGNPGVGKTTGAWALAKFLTDTGIVPRNYIREAHRDDIVDKWVGGTEMKVRQLVLPALGGVVILDEVYALNKPGNNNDFGKEALTTIMKYMTHENAPVFIFLGYKKEMEAFVNANIGLHRRIKYTLDIQDYTPHTLARIVLKNMNKLDLCMLEEVNLELYFRSFRSDYMQLRNATVAVDLLERAQSNARHRTLNMPYYQRKGVSHALTKEDFDRAARSIEKDCHSHCARDSVRSNMFL